MITIQASEVRTGDTLSCGHRVYSAERTADGSVRLVVDGATATLPADGWVEVQER